MSESQNNAIKRLRTNEALEEDLLQAEKENKRMADVVEAAKKSISFDLHQYIYDKEAGNLVDRHPSIIRLMESLAALNSDT